MKCPYDLLKEFQFQEEINGKLSKGSVAAANGATGDKNKKKKKFWEPEGCRCSHWGDLTEVLLGSLTPKQADENRNPCLKNNGGKKTKKTIWL